MFVIYTIYRKLCTESYLLKVFTKGIYRKLFTKGIY